MTIEKSTETYKPTEKEIERIELENFILDILDDYISNKLVKLREKEKELLRLQQIIRDEKKD